MWGVYLLVPAVVGNYENNWYVIQWNYEKNVSSQQFNVICVY